MLLILLEGGGNALLLLLLLLRRRLKLRVWMRLVILMRYGTHHTCSGRSAVHACERGPRCTRGGKSLKIILRAGEITVKNSFTKGITDQVSLWHASGNMHLDLLSDEMLHTDHLVKFLLVFVVKFLQVVHTPRIGRC